MRTKLLLADVAIAVALAVVVLIISPGAAITAMLVAAVLLVCVVSVAVGGLRARAARRPSRRRVTEH